jgi:hypothetical protein
MLRLLRFIIFGDGHVHTWEPFGQRISFYENEADTRPIRIEQTFICQKCGALRAKKVA